MLDSEKLRLTIRREEHVDNPREEFDHAGYMVCWHRRYDLGDEQPREEPNEYEIPKGSVVLPLYLYDHSGITISCGAFSCPWDSGQVGWIYATPEKIREGWLIEKGQPISDEVRAKVEACLKAEVAEYDAYLRCDVWYFELEEGTTCTDCGHTHWEHVESCGGFIDVDDCAKDVIADHLPDEARHLLDAAWEDRFY